MILVTFPGYNSVSLLNLTSKGLFALTLAVIVKLARNCSQFKCFKNARTFHYTYFRRHLE